MDELSWKERVRIANQIREAAQLPEFDLDMFYGELYPFQQRAVLFAYVLRRCLIADQVGLGKTVEALGLIAFIRHKMEDEGPIIIFTRAAATRQWQAEIWRFLRLNTAVLSGKTAQMRRYILSQDPEIILLNYELFVRDTSLFESLSTDPSIIILDEATVFKSRSAKTSRMLRSFTKRAKWVVGLSATPIESKLADIYSILEVLGVPGLPKWVDFKSAFVVTQQRQGYGRVYEKIVGYRDLGLALRFVSPWIIRRTASDVGGQLPDVVFREVVLGMSKQQRETYNEARRILVAGGDVSLPNFHELTKLCDFVRVGSRVISPKLDFIVDALRGDLVGEKAIVYATHLLTLDVIQNYLHSAGFTVVRMDGSVDRLRRQQIQNAFNDPNSGIDVLIANKVIQDSLNLPGASVMFLMDLPGANPARLTQLVGRMRRMGSEHKSVLAVLLMMADSHEVGLFETLNFREYLSLFVTGDHDSMLVPEELSKDQLLEILTVN